MPLTSDDICVRVAKNLSDAGRFWPDCKPEGPLFSAEFVCWPDSKPEGPLFSAEFVCLSVSVSDRHFYSSALTNFDETWSQGPYCDLVWPRP